MTYEWPILKKNGLKNEIYHMVFWQNIMVLSIILREQMVISESKYLLATVRKHTNRIETMECHCKMHTWCCLVLWSLWHWESQCRKNLLSDRNQMLVTFLDHFGITTLRLFTDLYWNVKNKSTDTLFILKKILILPPFLQSCYILWLATL